MTHEPRRVLSLLRVSGETQIDRTGLPRQTASITEICRDNNLIVEKGDEYRYEGLSGASVEKFPLFRAMLDRLKDPKIAGIVFADVSRFFRPEFVDQLGISKPFRTNGKLMFYEEGILDLRKDRDMSLFIEEAMKAGAYRKRMLKNVLWGRNERRNYGDCKSDPLPLGVKFVAHLKVRDELTTGHFEYTPETDRIKEAFRRVLAGESLSKIARDLNFGKPGRPNPNVVRQLLRSRWWIQEKASFSKRINAGMREDGTVYSGYRKKREEPVIVPARFNCDQCNVHAEPLTSREDFFAVQAILDAGKSTWVREKEQRTNSPYISVGVLVCNRCGRKLYTKPNKKNQKFYYRCSSHNNKHIPCGAPHVHQNDMDRELGVYGQMRLKDLNKIKRMAPDSPQTNAAAIEKQKTDSERRLDLLYEKLGDPKWDQTRIEKNIETTQKQVHNLKEQLAVATTPVKAHIDPEVVAKRWKYFSKMSIEEQRDAIRQTFSKVFVDYEADEKGEMKPVIIRVELRPQSHQTNAA